MKLLSYRSERGVRAGALVDGHIIDVWDALESSWAPGEGPGPQPLPTGLRAVLETHPQDDVAAAVAAAEAGPPLIDVELLPPITDPQKIVCVGLNYAAHAAEAGLEPPSSPTFFAKFANALAAPGAAVPLPAASTKVDYEAEVAFVIGNRARRRRRRATPSATSPATRCSTTSRLVICSSRRRSGSRARSSTAALPAGPTSSPPTRPGPPTASASPST